MSQMSQHVFEVPTQSLRRLHRFADRFLRDFEPRALREPMVHSCVDLIDFIDEEMGHAVVSAPRSELGKREAITMLEWTPAMIAIREDQWEYAQAGGNQARRVRGTIVHEYGHCLLHAPYVQRMVDHGQTLARYSRRSIPAYRDPEWQCFTYTGAVLMPLPVLENMPGVSAEVCADEFGVSVPFARSRLKQLRRNGLIPEEQRRRPFPF